MRGIGNIHGDNPVLHRILIDQTGILREDVVDLNHFARHRHDKVGSGFHRFDGTEFLTFLKGVADFGQIDIDNVAKIVLDALNGVAWEDDAQVVSLTVSKLKRTRSPERLSVVITECAC